MHDAKIVNTSCRRCNYESVCSSYDYCDPIANYDGTLEKLRIIPFRGRGWLASVYDLSSKLCICLSEVADGKNM